MGNNTSSLSPKMQAKLIAHINYDYDVKVEPYELELKPSTINDGGLGLFAVTDIPSGKVIIDIGTGTIDELKVSKAWYINDLAYKLKVNLYERLTQENLLDYCSDDNIHTNINTGILRQSSGYPHPPEVERMFHGRLPGNFVFTARDIKAGEELSKFYGPDYWSEIEFWKRASTSNFCRTNKLEDLPDQWILIDTCRAGKSFNRNIDMFAKKIADEYHYIMGYGVFHNPDFDSKINQGLKEGRYIDATKPDFSMYKLDEKLPNGMYFDKYLMTQK